MGLFKRLGSFAEKVWSVISGRDRPILEATRVADTLGIEPEPGALVGELRHELRAEGLATRIADVADSEYIPLNLYQEALIPWGRPYAYQVQGVGIDAETGERATTERWLTFSEEVEVGEVLRIAEGYFGREGEYPQVVIESMSVIGAEMREDAFYGW